MILILLMTTGQARLDFQDADLTQRLSMALRLRLSNVVTLEAPPDKDRARVVAVTGVSDARLALARFYKADFQATRPAAKGTVVIAQMPLRDAPDSDIVVIAVDEKNLVRGTSRVSSDWRVRSRWRRFMAQMLTRPAPRLATAGTHAKLMETRKRVALRASPTDRLADALLRQHALMSEVTDSFGQIADAVRRRAPLPVKAAKTAAKQMRSLAANADDLGTVLGKDKATYLDLVKRASEGLDGLEADSEELHIRSTVKHCSSCHEHRAQGSPLGIQKRSQRERIRLGIGSDHYLVGFDLKAFGTATADAQAVGDSVRSLLLLAERLRES